MIRSFARLAACLFLAFAALFAVAPTASAQNDVDIEDFTDEDGNIDFDGYLAALNASTSSGGGGLPATGSDSGQLIAIGAGLVLVGGSAIVWAQDRRRRTEA